MSFCDPKKPPRGDLMVRVSLNELFALLVVASLIGFGAGLAR